MFSQMINQIIHISSEWNPQLFRELKSRLTVKSVTLTLLGSLSAQALLMNSFLIKLHSSPKTNIDLQSYTRTISSADQSRTHWRWHRTAGFARAGWDGRAR